MQETITFPAKGSPHHRFTFSQSYETDFSERCSQVSTPFVSAPSSPGQHRDGGFYFSAPASPHWSTYGFTKGLAHNYPSSIPLHWDDQSGTPQRRSSGKDEAGSFLMTSDFEFSARFAELEDPSMSPTPMSSANELFCNGQIKPLRVPTRIDYPLYNSTSHTNMEEHECGITPLPYTFEFHSRGAYLEAPNSFTSTPHLPGFSSVLGDTSASVYRVHESNKSRSASSLSAPQSPCSPINRVKGALCGVSPSQIDRAFDTSIHIEVSREASQSSNKVKKPFDTSVHISLEGSIHTCDISRHARECSRRSERSKLSRALGSQVARGHRRTRSFSPLQIFHKGEHSSSSSPAGASQQEDYMHTLSREPSADAKKHTLLRESSTTDVKKHEDNLNLMAKSLNKKWTLKDLLHRKSGGENRQSGRASSRQSGRSANLTSSVERIGAKSLSAGRSSTESSSSSISSSNTYTKDVSMAKVGSRGRMQGGDQSLNNQSNASGISKGVLNQEMCEAKGSNNNKGSMCKPKNSSQRGIKGCVQMGTIEKGCISPHEMHYMMHKAQSEELRKRTFLPYRQGLLGCLGFTSKGYRTVSSISKTLQSVSG